MLVWVDSAMGYRLPVVMSTAWVSQGQGVIMTSQTRLRLSMMMKLMIY